MSASQSSASFEVTSVLVGSGNNNQGEYGGAPGRTVKTTASSTKIRRLKRKSKSCDACLAFLALQLGGVGLFASIASTCMCDYFKVNGTAEGEDGKLGIWRIPQNETSSILSCDAYPSNTPIDYQIRTSRAMTIVAPFLCFFGIMVAFFAEVGLPALQERRLLLSIVLLLAAASTQGLTLMILESDVCIDNPNIPGDGSCGLAFGAKLSIGSCSFMAAALFSLLVKGRKELELDTSVPSSHAGEQSEVPESYREGGDDETKKALSIKHGQGRFKFVDIWGKMV